MSVTGQLIWWLILNNHNILFFSKFKVNKIQYTVYERMYTIFRQADKPKAQMHNVQLHVKYTRTRQSREAEIK